MNLPGWIEKYRGRRYGPHGCYPFVREVLREQWGAEIAPLAGLDDLDALDRLGKITLALDDEAAQWEPHDGEPVPGDCLTFEIPDMPRDIHIAVVIAPGWMLHYHVRENGVQTSRFDRMPWAALRIGPAFRHKTLATVGAGSP